MIAGGAVLAAAAASGRATRSHGSAPVRKSVTARKALDQSSRYADLSLDEATLIKNGKHVLVAYIMKPKVGNQDFWAGCSEAFGADVPPSMLRACPEEVSSIEVISLSETRARACPRCFEGKNCNSRTNCRHMHPDFMNGKRIVPGLISHMVPRRLPASSKLLEINMVIPSMKPCGLRLDYKSSFEVIEPRLLVMLLRATKFDKFPAVTSSMDVSEDAVRVRAEEEGHRQRLGQIPADRSLLDGAIHEEGTSCKMDGTAIEYAGYCRDRWTTPITQRSGTSGQRTKYTDACSTSTLALDAPTNLDDLSADLVPGLEHLLRRICR
ncbi:rbcL [Symbiodinium sp. KB8]|nr:rbcL [Symbiodinium sp. KB8]